MFLYGLILYIPVIAFATFVAWLLRRSRLPVPVQRAAFVVVGVILLTPVLTPIATMYATPIPSAITLLSGDVGWYLRFWRIGIIGGVAMGFLCWLVAPILFKEADQANKPKYGRRLALGATLVSLVTLAVLGLQDSAERGPLLTTVDSIYTTCHDVLHDTGSRKSPVMVMDLSVDIADWRQLSKVFEETATKWSLEFRDLSYDRGTSKKLSLSICNVQSVNLRVLEGRYQSSGFRPAIEGRGLSIPVYTRHDRKGWADIAAGLIVVLEENWPGKVGFRDGDGYPITQDRAFQLAAERAPGGGRPTER